MNKLWLGGLALAAMVGVPMLSRASSIGEKLKVSFNGIGAKVNLTSLLLDVSANIQNFTGLGLTATNFWMRVQYQDANKNWSDIASSPTIIPKLTLAAGQVQKQKFAFDLSLLSILGKGLKLETPFRVVSYFDFAGLPQTVELHKFALGDYVPKSLIDSLKAFSGDDEINGESLRGL